MPKLCKIAVHYTGGEVARFSDVGAAQRFARVQYYAEVIAADGIIGQWRDGQPTPEFAHLAETYGGESLMETVADYLVALDAFRKFENEHPNDSSRRWEAVFEARNDAEERMATAFRLAPR